MNEEKFMQAKRNLQFSQQLRDSLMQRNIAQQSQEIPMDVPMQEETPLDVPRETEQESVEQKGIVEGVKEAITPMFEEIKNLFTNKEDPKEVEIKINGEMKPKKE